MPSVPARVVPALVLLGAACAWGGATSPTLVLSAASGDAVDGARAAVFEGSFDFANAVQVGYPLELVVFQGARFARFPVAAPPTSGTSPALADGDLVESEIDAVRGAGGPAPAGVRVVSLTETTLRVTLPLDFTAGTTGAILLAVLPEHPVLSNPIAFELP